MATGTGVNSSKVNVYALLSQPKGVSCSKTNVYAVFDTATAPSWPGFTFGNGVVGSPYSQSFSANGSSPITYTVQSGSLPAALSLTGSTIAGTPTTAGLASFTLRATNAFGFADQPFTISISAGGSSGGSFVFAS